MKFSIESFFLLGCQQNHRSIALKWFHAGLLKERLRKNYSEITPQEDIYIYIYIYIYIQNIKI